MNQSLLALFGIAIAVLFVTVGMTQLRGVERELDIQEIEAGSKKIESEKVQRVLSDALLEAVHRSVANVAAHGGSRAETVPPESFENIPYLAFKGQPTPFYTANWRPKGTAAGTHGLPARDTGGLASILEDEVKKHLLIAFRSIGNTHGFRPSYPRAQAEIGETYVKVALPELTVQTEDETLPFPLEVEVPLRLGLLHAIAGEIVENHLVRRGFEQSLVHVFLENDRRPQMRLFHCCGPCDPTWQPEVVEYAQVLPKVVTNAHATVSLEQGYARKRYQRTFPKVQGMSLSMDMREAGFEFSFKDLNPDRSDECMNDPTVCRRQAEKIPVLGAVQMGRWDVRYAFSFPVRIDITDSEARLIGSDGSTLVPLTFSFNLDAFAKDCGSCMPDCVAVEGTVRDDSTCTGSCNLELVVKDDDKNPVPDSKVTINECVLEQRTDAQGVVTMANAPCEEGEVLVEPPEGSGFAAESAIIYIERRTREQIFLRRSLTLSGNVYSVEKEFCKPRSCVRTVNAKRSLPPTEDDPPSYVRLTFVNLRDRITHQAIVDERSRYTVPDMVEGKYLVVAEGHNEYTMRFANLMEVGADDREVDIPILPAFVVRVTGGETEHVSRIAEGDCSC